jgi:hypothetical protein
VSARRASPRLVCRELTQAAANASSSTRPTALNRSSTRSATSSGDVPRAQVVGAVGARVFGAMVSRRSTIARATDSGSASCCGGPSGPSSVQPALREALAGPATGAAERHPAASDVFRRDRAFDGLAAPSSVAGASTRGPMPSFSLISSPARRRGPGCRAGRPARSPCPGRAGRRRRCTKRRPCGRSPARRRRRSGRPRG